MRLIKFIFLLVLCLTGSSVLAQDNLRNPAGVDEYYKALHSKILQYYPKATIKKVEKGINFEYNVRNFMIHEATKLGDWQEAWEVVGPNRGGIWGEIKVNQGKYSGAARLPFRSNKRYFYLYGDAAYSQQCDCHSYILFKVPPSGVSKDFLMEFQELIRDFDSFIK